MGDARKVISPAHFRRKVSAVDRRQVQPGGHATVDQDPRGLQLCRLVGVVREQVELVNPQGQEHLRSSGVVTLVLRETERQVCLVGVQTRVLQGVGVELVVRADTSPLLPQVQQLATCVGDAFDRFPQLRTAVAALAAEHVPSQALAVQPHQQGDRRLGGVVPRPVAQRERDVLSSVTEAFETEYLGGCDEAVGEAQRQLDLAADGGGCER